MRLVRSLLLGGIVLAGVSTPVSAQLLAAADGPVVYGHHHLTVTNVEAHKAFWIGALGGTPAKLGTNDAVVFTNVIVLFRQGAPTGGSKGTSVNHVGFGVPDIRVALAKLKAAGFPAITRAELPPSQEVKDDLAFIANQNTSVAFVMAPDDVKVELVEVKSQATPVALHHIHYYTPQVDQMKAWYVLHFGAKGGMRGAFQAADLPGVNLTFSPAPEGVGPTKGRSLDHVGYEVKDLEAFCRKLEAAGVKFDRPYSKNAALGLGLAFFTDPFGTYVELTEGLGAVVK
ncbi:MAG: VOC family protein [Acidobacteria bacterium]|nr:VOC family protein [Acidobacteriota bacterium]